MLYSLSVIKKHSFISCFCTAHSAVVTCAVFAPHPELVFSFIEQQQEILNKATQPQEEQQQQQQQQSQNKDSGTNNKGYVGSIFSYMVLLRKETI